MAKEQTTYNDFVANGEHLNTTLLANIAELPHLEVPRAKFEGILGRVRTLGVQHDLHTANKQQVAKELEALLADGRKLATFLRTGLKEHYGNRSDKLVEFGIAPFRRRKKEPAEPPEGETPPPAAPADPSKT
jgi:hypothetical protein